MMGRYALFRQLAEMMGRKQDQVELIPAVLGMGDENETVEVAGQPHKHWVRLYQDPNQPIPARRGTAAVHGLAVKVKISTDETTGRRSYQVVGQNDIIYENGYSDYRPYDVEEHGETHAWPAGNPGSDPVNVHPRNFAFGRVYASTPPSMRCVISPIAYAHLGERVSYAGGYTADLTSYVPATAGMARIVLIVLDGETNAVEYVSGDEFAWTGYTDAVPPSAFPDPEPGQLVLGSPILYEGMSSIREANFRYDYRLPFETLRPAACRAGTEAERAAAEVAGRANTFWRETDTSSLWLTDGEDWFFVATLVPEYPGS